MKFPGKNTGMWLPFLTPVYLPEPGIEPLPLVSPVLAGKFFTTVPPGEPWNGRWKSTNEEEDFTLRILETVLETIGFTY